MAMKTCRECKKEKTVDNFPANKRAKDKIAYYCKECHNAKRVRYNHENLDRIRNQRLMWSFGIDLSRYNKIFSDQGGCCAICSKHQSEFKEALNVDHSHKTGEIRGLLCRKCNTGIGLLQDSCVILEKAFQYLKRLPCSLVEVKKNGTN